MNKELKLATNIDEQIAKLVERGMVINNVEKARENLLDIGYFRLGFYWFPFEKSYPRKRNRDHIFKDGVKIEYAIQLYYFDFDLRNSFLRYISRIEINFRTKLIYMASNKYREDPFWYVNSRYVDKSFLNSKAFISINRQNDLVASIRKAFSEVDSNIVKTIICDNSGFDIESL